MPLNVRPGAIKLRDTTDQFIWESPKTGLPCNPTHFRDVFRKSLEEAGDVEGSPTIKPPPFQTNLRMAEVMSASSHQMPPVWAVSASPTLIMTSNESSRCGSFLISSKLINFTSKGAPDSISMTPA